MSDDHSPGDARKPYSDRGGPEGRHAETHDVRSEQLTNPKGPEPEDESFVEDLAQETPDSIRQAQVESTGPASAAKDVVNRLPDLSSDELAQISVLDPGTPLEQGSTYLDLSNRARGPFTAVGGQQAENSQRLVAHKTTDYETWNRLIGKATGEE
jgi:hypothetical protein